METLPNHILEKLVGYFDLKELLKWELLCKKTHSQMSAMWEKLCIQKSNLNEKVLEIYDYDSRVKIEL